MNREEAKLYTGWEDVALNGQISIEDLVDKIYDDFESRICENCKHISILQDWCPEIEHGFPCDYIGGCNKFKRKE